MPEKTRILFIGEMDSSHAQSWVHLLDAFQEEFEIQAINISPWGTWVDAPIPIYNSIYQQAPISHEQPVLLDMLPQEWNHYIPVNTLLNPSVLESTRAVIDAFCPHVIHTFGLFPSAVFYAQIIESTSLQWRSKWVLQTRGGSDFDVPIKKPSWRNVYEKVIALAHALLCDNEYNFRLLEENNIYFVRHPSLSLAPGTGGMENKENSIAPIHTRERIILWPKPYDIVFSKARPVLEGLCLALEHIKPVKIICFAADTEICNVVSRLPDPLQQCFEFRTRIPREEFLQFYRNARVMLAPSLVDGIPNVLYEAMNFGLIPIVSPLPTLTPHFEDGKQLLYARNLYPNEIAEALIKAMNDDALAERITQYNATHFPFFARRPDIQKNVRELYLDIAGKIDPMQTELGRTKSALHQCEAALRQSQDALANAQRILHHPIIKMQCKLLNLINIFK